MVAVKGAQSELKNPMTGIQLGSENEQSKVLVPGPIDPNGKVTPKAMMQPKIFKLMLKGRLKPDQMI